MNKVFSMYSFQGVWGLAIIRSCINKHQLQFDEAFGPGTTNPMGEDSIYLRDLLKRSNNVFTSIDLLTTIEQESSTWFKGYDRNYFINLGKTTKRIYPYTYLFRVIKNVIYYTLKKKNPFKVTYWMLKRI